MGYKCINCNRIFAVKGQLSNCKCGKGLLNFEQETVKKEVEKLVSQVDAVAKAKKKESKKKHDIEENDI